jgi:hypothetical protein
LGKGRKEREKESRDDFMLWEKIDLAREEGCLEIPQNRISSLLTPKSKAQPLKKRSCGLGGSQVDRTQSFT